METQSHRVEKLNYQLGGFHPVHLGDVFKNKRYEVIHKLGHGGFATVWLARDSKRQRYVALKILAARLSKNCPEVDILRRLIDSDEHRGKPYVMRLLDHFWIHGPNGNHLCVVSTVGGPSIKEFNDCPGLKSGTRRLKEVVARRVALQATEGLAYIHHTGTVHGDFTAANILLQLTNIDEWSLENINERFGSPERQDLHYTTRNANEGSSPRYTVNAINMKQVDPRWLSDQIMIVDFGIAFLREQATRDIGTPKNYCAPEFSFEGRRSTSSDIWALGCTIFEIRTGSQLFRYRGVPTRDQLLISAVQLLGTLPDQWWRLWEKGEAWYSKAIEEGGELSKTIQGTLYQQIMEIGQHDGDNAVAASKHRSLDDEQGSTGELLRRIEEQTSSKRHEATTARLVKMVENLTTNEAAEVVARLDKSSTSSSNEQAKSSGTGSSSSNKAQSGASNSSRAKSGESSQPSEGVATRIPAAIRTDEGTLSVQADGETPATNMESGGAIDLLASPGTTVSVLEADSLENLLRQALAFLPGQRLAACELAKHRWFTGEYSLKN